VSRDISGDIAYGDISGGICGDVAYGDICGGICGDIVSPDIGGDIAYGDISGDIAYGDTCGGIGLVYGGIAWGISVDVPGDAIACMGTVWSGSISVGSTWTLGSPGRCGSPCGIGRRSGSCAPAEIGAGRSR
jgi:hypothetical protein